jgi:DNA methyltransferase 1-associated protein 1
VWKPIVHPARPAVDRDKPFLSHWVKAGEENIEYPWAKFNKKLAIPTYTDEQYKKYFQGERVLSPFDGLHSALGPLLTVPLVLEDNDWTREETDTLFDLCERFDLRFIVIHDRFPNPKRTIEVGLPLAFALPHLLCT